MSQCKPIHGLTLDHNSKKAIERILNKSKNARHLRAALSVGNFVNIFSSKKALPVMYSITATDWELFSEAMAAVGTIEKRVIRQEIDLLQIEYCGLKYDHKLCQFWTQVGDGCGFQNN